LVVAAKAIAFAGAIHHPIGMKPPAGAPHSVAAMEPVLVAYNAQTDDRGPIEFGLAASRVTGAPLVVLWVYRGGEAAPEAEMRVVERLREDLGRRGCASDVVAVAGWSVGVEITDAAARLGALMIVLGTTRRGAAQAALLGTTAERVIQDAACPVAVVPRVYAPLAGRINVVGAACTPSPEGRFALSWAAGLARAGGVRLHAFQVVQQDRAGAEAALREATRAVAAGIDAHVEVVEDDPADALVAATRRLELLVMGSRGGGSTRAVMLGSVSRRVAEHAECPVIILPRAAQAAADGLLARFARRGSAPAIAEPGA
jgi:nucleotide-binding universal stress UspA family protein